MKKKQNAILLILKKNKQMEWAEPITIENDV